MTEPLEEIQDRIVGRLHAGEEVDREALLREHPEHAEALRGFFQLLELIEDTRPAAPIAPSRLGEFAIVRELGRGGMGVVYEAEQLSLKRRVALKVLPPAVGRDERLLARFKREAEAAGRLRHPGIVPVYSFGELGGTPFFAMELVEGRSLADVLRARRTGEDDGLPRQGPDWHRWAIGVVARVADALAYAHERGILHRDVKPANVLLDRDGTPRLTDFGLALDLWSGGMTLAGEIFGSPQYMSPEQAFRRQSPLDRRTDVYSLAVTLYELVTLRLPYDGETASEYLTALERGAIVPPRAVDATVPEALERVLLRGLARDPAQRYGNAALFAEDLRALLEARPVAAPRAARSAPRRRVVLAALALAVMLVAGLAAWKRFRGARVESQSFVENELLAGTASALMIHSLADGTALPDGSAFLREWIASEVELRRIVARDALGSYRALVRFPLPDRVDPDVRASVEWRARIGDEPWKALRPGASEGSVNMAGPGTTTLSQEGDLDWLLEGMLERGSVEVVHEATVRIHRVGSESGGTSATFTDRRVLLLYDAYPPDYPTSVSSPELDEIMEGALTPREVRYVRAAVLGNGRKSVELAFQIRHQGGTLPAAVEIDLLWPDRAGASATGEFWQDRSGTEGEPWTNHKVSSSHSVVFEVAEMPPEDEQRFLLDLESGRVKELRLAVRSSRRVALERTHFDRCWAGAFEVTVPLARQER